MSFRFIGNGTRLLNESGSTLESAATLSLFPVGLSPIDVTIAQIAFDGYRTTYSFLINVDALLPNLNSTAQAQAAVRRALVPQVFDSVNFGNAIPANLPTTPQTQLGQQVYGNQNNTFWGAVFGGGNTYKVVAGDTLSKISTKTNTPIATLISLNSATYPSLRTNPNLINIGWVLRTNGTVTPSQTQQPQAQQQTQILTPTQAQQIVNNPLPPPPPPKSKFLDDLSKSFGVAPYVIGVAGLAVVLILLVPRK